MNEATVIHTSAPAAWSHEGIANIEMIMHLYVLATVCNWPISFCTCISEAQKSYLISTVI